MGDEGEGRPAPTWWGPKGSSQKKVCLPASQLLQRLQTVSVYALDLLEEEQSMHHFVKVMMDVSELNDIQTVRHLNLKMLFSYELPGRQIIASKFYACAAGTFKKLVTLRVGKACLDPQNGVDQHGKLDVDYLINSIPKWHRLRVLDLSYLGLSAEHAGDILVACSRCPSLEDLDLSQNLLRELHPVVKRQDVQCHLKTLNLSGNAFGDFDDWQHWELTCDALEALLSQYTSLRELDLSSNNLGTWEGQTIANVLDATCTHLVKLNISDNTFGVSPRSRQTISDSIRTAWIGPAPIFLLTR